MAFHELKDKVPPHNVEAEQSVLGAILIERAALHKASAVVSSQDFYKTAHQKIYQAIVNLSERNEVPDLITLSDELVSSGELDLVGGSSYISRLTSIVPSAANVEYYAKIVKDCAVRRSLLGIAHTISSMAFEPTRESREAIEEAEKGLFAITDNQAGQDYRRIKDLVSPAIKAIEDAHRRKGAYTGVVTGFEDLDSMTAGFQESEFVIIGARPSIGKTALALSMAANMALKTQDPIPVGFFSLEMSSNMIVQRLLSMEAKVDAKRIRSGLLHLSDFNSIVNAAGIMYEAPLWIADTPNMRLLDLRAQARRMRSQHGVRIIFIDYISLITPERTDIPRYEQIAEISRSLKALARELKIPVVALSQVKRETEGKQPNLSDLRESGSIEQDADVVMFLHRERRHESKGESDQSMIPTEIILAKQRNGPIGSIDIGFQAQFARFVPLTRDQI